MSFDPTISSTQLANAQLVSFINKTATLTKTSGDTYKIVIDDIAKLEATLQSKMSNFDFALYDSVGKLYYVNNTAIQSEKPSSLPDNLSVTLLNGTYYLVIKSPTTTAGTGASYTLTMSQIPLTPTDLAGASQETSSLITPNYTDKIISSPDDATTDGYVGGGTDTVDFYKFQVSGVNKKVQITLTGFNDNSVRATLTSNTGINKNIGSANSGSIVYVTDLATNIDSLDYYYIQVFPADLTTADTLTPYQLNIQYLDDVGNIKENAKELSDTVSSTNVPILMDQGDTLTNLYPLNAVYSEYVDSKDSHDWYSFTLTDDPDTPTYYPDWYSVGVNLGVAITKANPKATSADITLKLYNSSGTVIQAGSVNKVDSQNSDFIFDRLQSGTYYIDVTPAKTTGAEYNIALKSTSYGIKDDLAGNSIAESNLDTLKNIDELQTITDAVGLADPFDYFQFKVDNLSTINIQVTNGNPKYEIVDPTGKTVKGTDLSKGLYYLKLSSTVSPVEDYQIKIQRTDWTPIKDNAGNDVANANTKSIGAVDLTKSVKNPITDYIGKTDSSDYYEFTIPTFAVADANGNYADDGYRYTINVKNEISTSIPTQNIDFSMRVVDSSDNAVSLTSDITKTGSRDTALKTTTLKAGTYYVRLNSLANPAFQYNLNVGFTTNTNPNDNNNIISNITNAENIISSVTTNGTTITQFVGGSTYAVNGVYDSYDFYKITAKPNAGEDWTIASKAPFSIVDSTGKVLLDSKSGSTLSYQSFLKPRLIDSNENLYIRIEGQSYKTPTQYDLTIKSVATQDLAGNSIAEANTKQLGILKLNTASTISDYIGGGTQDDSDYYAFTLPKSNDTNVYNLNITAKTLQSSAGVSIDLFDKYADNLFYAPTPKTSSSLMASSSLIPNATTVDFYELEKYADPTKQSITDTRENLIGGETYYIKVTPNNADFALYALNLTLSARYEDPNDTTAELAIAPKDIYNLGFPTSAGQFVTAKEETTKPSIGGVYNLGTANQDGDIIDYYYFKTGSSLNDQQYTLSLDKKAGITMSVLDATGSELINFGSTSGGGVLNSTIYSAFDSIQNTILQPDTTYYVKLEADSTITKPTEYALKLTSSKLDDLAGNSVKAGNVTALASTTTYSANPVNTTIADFIGTVDSLDYYTFTVTGAPVRVTLTGSSVNNTQTFGKTAVDAIMNPTNNKVSYTIVDENDKTVSIGSRENQYYDFTTNTVKDNSVSADSYVLGVGKYSIKLGNNTATPADRYSIQVQIDPSVSNHMALYDAIKVSKNASSEQALTQFTSTGKTFYDNSSSQFASSANSLGNIIAQDASGNLTIRTSPTDTVNNIIKYTGTDYSAYTGKNLVGNHPAVSGVVTISGQSPYAIIAFESNDSDLIATLIAGGSTNTDTIAIAQEKAKLVQNAIIVGKANVTSSGNVSNEITDLTLLSLNPDVTSGYLYNAFNPSISDDGKKLAFTAYPEVTANITKAYSSTLGFTQTATTPTAKWGVANLALTKDTTLSSGGAIISSDGKSIAFTTNVKRVTGELDTKNQAIDEDNFYDIYVKNTAGTKLVSRASSELSTDGKTKIGGVKGNNSSGNILTPLAISSDGKYVVFSSSASNLVTNDQNNAPDIFVRDTVNEKTSIISMSTNGLQALYNTNPTSKPVMKDVSISPDGRYISFAGESISLTVVDPTTQTGLSDATGQAFVTPNPLFTIDQFGREVNHIRDHATPIELIADKDVEGTDKLIGGIDDTTDYYVFIPKANYDISYTFTGKSTDGNALDQGVFDGRIRFERPDGSEIMATNGTILGTDIVAGQPVYVKIDGNELTSSSYSLKLKATTSTLEDRDNNGTFNTAKRLTFSRSGIAKSDVIGGSTDRDDFFKIIVPANKSYSAALIDKVSNDYKTDYLTIYNAVGTPLNLTSGGNANKIEIPQKTYDQLYYLRVSNYTPVSKRKNYKLNITPVTMVLDSTSDTGKANDYITNDTTPTLRGQLSDLNSSSVLNVYKQENNTKTLLTTKDLTSSINPQTGEWAYTLAGLENEFNQAYGNSTYVFEIKTTATSGITTDIINVIEDTKIPVVTDNSIQLNFDTGASPFDATGQYINQTENAKDLYLKFGLSDLQYANPNYTLATSPTDDDTIHITWNNNPLPNSGKYLDYYKNVNNEYLLKIPASTLVEAQNGTLGIEIHDIAGNISAKKSIQFTVDTQVTSIASLGLLDISSTTISFVSGAELQKDNIKGLRVVLNPATATQPTDIIKVYLNGGTSPVLTKTVGTVSATNTYDFTEAEIQNILGAMTGGASLKFTATVEDVAGNISTVYSNLSPFTMILRATGAPTVTGIITADDSGASNSDNYTNIANPTIIGTAEANATVTLYNNGAVLGTTTSNTSGAWSFQIPTVSQNTTLSVTAKAIKAGQSDSGVSEAKTITIDLASPIEPTIILSANRPNSSITDEIKKDGYINIAEKASGYGLDVKFGTDVVAGDILRLYWTSDVNTTGSDIVASYVIKDADITNKYAPITISGNFDLGADGVKNFVATIKDKAGNVSTAGQLSLTQDTASPLSSAPLVTIGGTTLEKDKKTTLSYSASTTNDVSIDYKETVKAKVNNVFSSISVDSASVATTTKTDGSIFVYPLTGYTTLWQNHALSIPKGAISDVAGNTNLTAFDYIYYLNVDLNAPEIVLDGVKGATWMSLGRDGVAGINDINYLNNYIYFYSIQEMKNPATIDITVGDYVATSKEANATYLFSKVDKVDFSKLDPLAVRQPRIFLAGTKAYSNDTVSGVQSYSYKASPDGDIILGNPEITNTITSGASADIIVIEHDGTKTPSSKGNLIVNNAQLGVDKLGLLIDTNLTNYQNIKDLLDLGTTKIVSVVNDATAIDPNIMEPIIVMRSATDAHTVNVYSYDGIEAKQIATLHLKDNLTLVTDAELETSLQSMLVLTQQGLQQNTPILTDTKNVDSLIFLDRQNSGQLNSISGRDTVQIANPTDAHVTQIVNFEFTNDRINLVLPSFDNDATLGTIDAPINSNAFEISNGVPTQGTSATSRIIANTANPSYIDLYWDKDGNGSTNSPMKFATLVNVFDTGNISSTNFNIVSG